MIFSMPKNLPNHICFCYLFSFEIPGEVFMYSFDDMVFFLTLCITISN